MSRTIEDGERFRREGDAVRGGGRERGVSVRGRWMSWGRRERSGFVLRVRILRLILALDFKG